MRTGLSVPSSEHEKFKKLVQENFERATPRGRDVRKMEKPYSCREILFTCSNGWTIELLPPADHAIEGFFMGHCMGGPKSTDRGKTCASLREPDGTPHVTMDLGYDRENMKIAPMQPLSGRCNAYPKPKYVRLINEYMEALWETDAYNFSDENRYSRWGYDTDDEYHEQGHWTDRDFRDLDHGRPWRTEAWQQKREEAAA